METSIIVIIVFLVGMCIGNLIRNYRIVTLEEETETLKRKIKQLEEEETWMEKLEKWKEQSENE